MMSSERHTRTLQIARTALAQIIALELPADPQSFELWYLYASGLNEELNQAVNLALEQQGTLSEADANRFYNRYVSSARSSQRLNAVANWLADEIAQVTGTINAVVSTADTFDQSLDAGLEVLDSAAEDAFKPVVEALIAATREMESKNRSLEKQLQVSREKTDQLQREVETIRLESQTDPLTKVANRQYFDEAIHKMACEARLTVEPLTLLLVDIDHFKTFNDKYGHQVGDEVLRFVAGKMRDCVREGEVVARYGGEEFAVLIPGKPLAIGKLLGERIRRTIEGAQMRMRSTGANLNRVTVSIGVAELDDDASVDALIGRADRCLYAAKTSGRNQVMSDHDAESVLAAC